MKKLSKLLTLGLSMTMVLSLAACGNGGNASSPAPTTPAESTPVASPVGTTPAEAPGGETYSVGVCQLAPHDALDAATQGFKDTLTAALGDAVTFQEGNAGGDANNCVTIIDGFLSGKVDLILANATAPLQAAASATADIPVLGTSVSDYGTALEISDWTGTVGGNISGTSDLAPLDQQAAMLNELFPDAKNVGLLYCSGEPNSVYQVETITGYLEGMGYTCTPYAFTDVNDLAAVTQTACDSSEVIYIPTDNTAANNTETIANVVIPAGVPVVAGEAGICKGCGVATLSIDYYELGQVTGEMALEILTKGADVSTMPVEFAPNVTKMYNAANCEALNITLPDGYTAIEG